MGMEDFNEEAKTIKVKLSFTVEVDVAAWATEYEVTPTNLDQTITQAVREHVKGYFDDGDLAMSGPYQMGIARGENYHG